VTWRPFATGRLDLRRPKFRAPAAIGVLHYRRAKIVNEALRRSLKSRVQLTIHRGK
jgi:hypothetical protein